MTIKVDMHVHTSRSAYSLIQVDDLLATCDCKGIDCVAVIDHDTAEGALELHEEAPGRVIVGEEIHTTAGEIAGLFLKETIQPGLSPLETIERIKEQGGLVYLPHPFDNMRSAVLKDQAREEVWEKIDIVESYNSRSVFPWNDWKAAKFAKEKGILAGVGSDAHARYELGMAYVIIEQFDSADDFLTKLADAEIRARRTSMTLNLLTKIYKLIRRIG